MKCQSTNNHHPMDSPWSLTGRCSKDESHTDNPEDRAHKATVHDGRRGFTLVWF